MDSSLGNLELIFYLKNKLGGMIELHLFVLRAYSWHCDQKSLLEGLGNCIWCVGSNMGQLHVKQVYYTLYYRVYNTYILYSNIAKYSRSHPVSLPENFYKNIMLIPRAFLLFNITLEIYLDYVLMVRADG